MIRLRLPELAFLPAGPPAKLSTRPGGFSRRVGVPTVLANKGAGHRLLRLFTAMSRRRAKAKRAIAAARLAHARSRNDSRSIGHATEAMKRSTTALLRAELGR